jgi:phage baseplate assembly protein W
MANILSRFRESVVGSDSKDSDYVSRIIPTGDFKRIKDINVILNSINNILITPTRTYIFDPVYGSDLYKMVFEPSDNTTAEKIKNEVVSKIQIYESRATIKKVNVGFFNNGKGFTISLTIEYDGDTSQMKVDIDESIYYKFFESTG